MTDNQAEEDKMTTTLVGAAEPNEPKPTEKEEIPPVVIPMDNRLHDNCCDKRGCTAQIMAVFKNAKDKLLSFCQHHANKVEPGLIGQGFQQVPFIRQ